MQVKGVEALRMSLEAVRFATHHFSDIIEKGGYDKVYRGELSHSKGQKSIIFNLETKATDSIDAARGLAYIHSGSASQYSMHGDIKISSILLNNDWEAVISDFIISKGVSTLGYYDPLYTSTGILTQKSDVYSFCVVLFEILSGRLAIETIKVDQQQPVHGDHEDGQVVFLSQLAVQCFKNKRLEEITFDDIKEQIDEKSLVVFSNIAYQCLQELPKDHPRMVDVVKELEKAYECHVSSNIFIMKSMKQYSTTYYLNK
ncbi:putative protein kinase RLK-Pelle-WAK family [Helianthus annuus]|nr:putative protein kinase RLK-Pelle-WAK family [Helianthus annuus]